MSDPSRKPSGFSSALRDILQRTHAGTSLITAAIADQQLQDGLLVKMRELNREQRDRLFEGYGPLSSFSAKIDMAYAFGFIDAVTYNRLTMVRRIRNKFAHCDETLTFESDEIKTILVTVDSEGDAKQSPQDLYLSHAIKIEAALVAAFGCSVLRPSQQNPS